MGGMCWWDILEGESERLYGIGYGEEPEGVEGGDSDIPVSGEMEALEQTTLSQEEDIVREEGDELGFDLLHLKTSGVSKWKAQKSGSGTGERR